ncbi:MAG: WD40 repeat domain-containing protein [Okeania sp. SIO4D6]|nr:WD40 repeat domain-containing protein [Okeania sp. SIO4D6]
MQTNLVNQRYGEKLIETVVQKLADEKLVVTTEIVAKGGGAERVAVVDVAHEALIRHWSLLRSWVSENRDVIRIKRKIEMAAEEWKSQGKLRDYLLVGLKLTEAENFLGNYFDLGLLSVLGKEFIERSIQQRKINKWFRVGEFAAFISVVVLGAGLSIYLGMQLSVQLQKQPLFQIQNQTLFQNFGSPSAIAFSPDGQLILTGSRDTIRLWNREGKLLHTVAGHTGDVTAIAFSPDGKLILSASRDRTLRLWDTDSGQLLHTMKGHKDDVTAIAFSPDGQQILSASRDRTLRLWDTDSGQLLRITSE